MSITPEQLNQQPDNNIKVDLEGPQQGYEDKETTIPTLTWKKLHSRPHYLIQREHLKSTISTLTLNLSVTKSMDVTLTHWITDKAAQQQQRFVQVEPLSTPPEPQNMESGHPETINTQSGHPNSHGNSHLSMLLS